MSENSLPPIRRLRDGIEEQIEYVERYGIGPSKEVHVTDLYEWRGALDELVEEWACDDCGVRKSTCSKNGRQLCNECAGLTRELDDELCEYCESESAVEWSDQGKRQCDGCSPP